MNGDREDENIPVAGGWPGGITCSKGSIGPAVGAVSILSLKCPGGSGEM